MKNAEDATAIMGSLNHLLCKVINILKNYMFGDNK